MENHVKVFDNNKKEIEPVYIPEEEIWNWSKFLLPELFQEMSNLLTVRNPKRFQFYNDLNKFVKNWKKNNKTV
jgi:hypothetical protein